MLKRFNDAARAALAPENAKKGFLGPLLFIIAIIVVVGAVLAKSQGGFQPSTSRESNRLAAVSIQSQGGDIANGVSRVLAAGYDVGNIASTKLAVALVGTGTTVELFSADGGGLTVPSPDQKAVAGSTDVWTMTHAGTVPDLGTAGATSVAFIQVKQGVCESIQKNLYGPTATVPAVTGTIADATADFDATGLPTAAEDRVEQCVQSGTDYFYYKTLSAF